MENFRKIIFSGLFICLLSCSAGTSISSSGGDGGNFREDLSSFRPRYDVSTEEALTEIEEEPEEPFAEDIDPESDVTARLNQKLSAIAENAPETAKGFRVQIYSGNSSDKAKEAKEEVEELICDEYIYIDYKIPNFRVRVGNAINRVQANYILSRLKEDFPDAMVVPDNNIDIKLKECE